MKSVDFGTQKSLKFLPIFGGFSCLYLIDISLGLSKNIWISFWDILKFPRCLKEILRYYKKKLGMLKNIHTFFWVSPVFYLLFFEAILSSMPEKISHSKMYSISLKVL